jgi:hypothetical protein
MHACHNLVECYNCLDSLMHTTTDATATATAVAGAEAGGGRDVTLMPSRHGTTDALHTCRYVERVVAGMFAQRVELGSLMHLHTKLPPLTFDSCSGSSGMNGGSNGSNGSSSGSSGMNGSNSSSSGSSSGGSSSGNGSSSSSSSSSDGAVSSTHSVLDVGLCLPPQIAAARKRASEIEQGVSRKYRGHRGHFPTNYFCVFCVVYAIRRIAMPILL